LISASNKSEGIIGLYIYNDYNRKFGVGLEDEHLGKVGVKP